LYHANQESDEVIGGSSKTAQHSIHTYVHTLFATPQRGFSVTKGIKKIKNTSIKMNKQNGKGV